MKIKWLIMLAAAAAIQGREAFAQDTNGREEAQWLRQRIEELEKKVQALEGRRSEAETNKAAKGEELDQRLKILERNREIDQETAQAKAKEAPKVSIGSDGFSLVSADANYAIQLRGLIQLDSRSFFNDGGIRGNDSFLMRRVRPILQGTVYRDFDFLFVPDFGGTSGPQLFDAYLNYKYRPELQLRLGKFKSPVGLEQLQADADTLFNERALATDLTPNRDVGAQLHGELFDGVVSYAAGIFNGVGDSRNSSNVDFEDNKAFAGRIFFRPFKSLPVEGLQGFGFGLGGSYEKMQGTNIAGLPSTTGGTLAGYTTDGQQQFFAYNPASNAVVVANGEHWRLSPQGSYYFGPFGFLGEYVISDQRVSRTVIAPLASARLANTAWQITGSWVLTGEDALYNGRVVPRSPFDLRQGQWGALQLVGRYAELNIDDAAFPLFSNPGTSARSARSWSAGFNWYLNRNIEIKATYSHTGFKGGGGAGLTPPANVTRQDESVFFTRVQLAF